MRTFRYAAVSHFSKLLLSLLFAITSILCANAQVTPLSVGSAGVGPFTFDDPPLTNHGWSTRSVGGSNTSVGTNNSPVLNQSQEDLAVSTNSASLIINPILADATPTPPQGSASTSGAFRWNSSRHFLESRPSSNDRAELLLTLRNDSGADRSLVVLDYDFGVDLTSNSADMEDPGLYGYRVYWSLTGSTSSWTHIPELDTAGPMGAGPKHAQIPVRAWEVGANLYVLWVDDNGLPGGSGTAGAIEGPYTIDNLQIQWDGCELPITSQPHDITIETCRSSNLTVTASGAGPINYQWYKGSLSNPIPGATGSTLNFFDAHLTDAGTYFVAVMGPFCGSVESLHVTVTVNEDSVQPGVLSAIGLINGTNVVVTFSEPMFAPTTGNSGSYWLHPISGGSDTIPLSARLTAAGTILTLAFSEARVAGTAYELIIDGTVTDACGNPLTTDRIPLWYEVLVMTLTNTTWKYNAEGQDLGTNWYHANYDVSAWQTGLSLLDGKQETTNFTPTPRMTVNGQEVLTQLPQRLNSGTYATSNIPVYYFRSSFTLPVSLSHVKVLRLRPFVDDFDIVYLNGNGTPAHMNPGNPQLDSNFFGYPGGIPVADANFAGPYDVNVTNLVEGMNLIAVKLYQASIGSSDISLGYEILAVVDTLAGFGPGPQLSVSEDPGTGTITLTSTPGTGSTLYESDSLTAPAGTWSAVAGASDGSYSFTPPPTGGTQKFYLLRK